MSAVAIAAVSIVALVLAAVAFGPDIASAIRRRRDRPARPNPRINLSVPDPGRELRAQRRAEQLLRSVLGQDAFDAYRALGFLHMYGRSGPGGEEPTYGYLIYPHKPIVSYDVETGELLNEHCVSFPDRTDAEFGERLPEADDVLAKWMALKGDEVGLISTANMHLPGRQLDPRHVRRDLIRLSEWTGRSASMPQDGAGSI